MAAIEFTLTFLPGGTMRGCRSSWSRVRISPERYGFTWRASDRPTVRVQDRETAPTERDRYRTRRIAQRRSTPDESSFEEVRTGLCPGGRWIRTSGSGERGRVSSLGLLLARDRGVGADVSVQPGFVIIMPSPLEASGAPLCCSPVDPEDDERDQAPTIRAICRTDGCKYLEWTRVPRSR